MHLQLTFFRSAAGGPEVHPLYFAHLAMSGGATGDFNYAERIARGTLGEAGADQPVYHVWLDNWRASQIGRRQVLEAWDKNVGGFRLIATPEGGPVLNGDRGFSAKTPDGSEASYYYSIPYMEAKGYLLLPEKADGSDGESTSQSSSSSHPERSEGYGGSSGNKSDSSPTAVAVTGQLWMDHEFGNQGLSGSHFGWDWWGLPLPGGDALMLYRIRDADGNPIPQSEGTFIRADGTTVRLRRDDVKVTVTGEWTSPASGIRYPHGWKIAVPHLKLSLTVTPVRDDQELRTGRSTRVTYYEGAVLVHRKGYKDGSYGFVEMVGYRGK